ncbi:TetR/AcrR family transcriptional regulator [Marinifilum sp. RC60d5]|uniref:TetR/AcrR family transcriptional regulator n=1 Tax=Marinifilum sp. RC60d5 TaxID=3458414 RepID=UPI00403604AF
MARKKKYTEEEVIEKAMNLFWQNGYESTSVRMLEKAMGINQFSMYSSFGSKQGVLLESIKCYKNKLNEIVNKLKESPDGAIAIKQFFYDFLEISSNSKQKRGCLLVNTATELGEDGDEEILSEIWKFVEKRKALFIEKLKTDSSKSDRTILKQVNYLLIAQQGLAVASKFCNQQELEDFIETTFEKL